VSANPKTLDEAETDAVHPIELLTENGFVIVRPWEADGSAQNCEAIRFLVRDGNEHERDVTVEVAPHLIAQTVLHTNGRIRAACSFWIVCAERHLANYLARYNDFPKDNRLAVTELDREEVLLAARWGKRTPWMND
jgi:hypothetical protein